MAAHAGGSCPASGTVDPRAQGSAGTPVSQPELLILLSSFNGHKFILDQITSIRRQTYSDWTLLVRDDGSSDNTVALVESLARQDQRIRLLRDTKGNLGPAASFGVLLAQARDSDARYVALADQDDVWLP